MLCATTCAPPTLAEGMASQSRYNDLGSGSDNERDLQTVVLDLARVSSIYHSFPNCPAFLSRLPEGIHANRFDATAYA